MLATYLYTLALLSATPSSYYNGQPATYSYEVEQKTTIGFYADTYEGTIYGYADVSLKYHGEYNVLTSTCNLQTGYEAVVDYSYDGTADSDSAGFTMALPTQQDAFTSVGHFRVDVVATDGIEVSFSRPILPDDEWQVYSTDTIWQAGGGDGTEELSGQCDLQISPNHISGLFKENGYLPWDLGNTLDYGETRYQDGHEAGYQEGYNNGLIESGEQGNEAMTNMFGILGLAFSSVSSFFELRLFGFLPLYWVFLAPLFIAIVTLIMRMVKH